MSRARLYAAVEWHRLIAKDHQSDPALPGLSPDSRFSLSAWHTEVADELEKLLKETEGGDDSCEAS